MADGFVWPPRQQVGAGSACPTGYGRQRGQGSLRCLSLCLRCVAPAAATGSGHCPARTPSNAVPWVRSEKDTFLLGQLLVSAGKQGDSN